MKTRNVAIVGATGAVGRVFLDVLAKRKFPIGELHVLASERSAGKHVDFAGRVGEVHAIGDCAGPGLLRKAVEDGLRAGAAL